MFSNFIGDNSNTPNDKRKKDQRMATIFVFIVLGLFGIFMLYLAVRK